MIDFRFAVSKKTDREDFLVSLKQELTSGSLKNLYGITENDEGPEAYSCTPYSSVFIESSINVLNNNIHLFAYFDNENSVNRYYDLTNYISYQL